MGNVAVFTIDIYATDIGCSMATVRDHIIQLCNGMAIATKWYGRTMVSASRNYDTTMEQFERCTTVVWYIKPDIFLTPTIYGALFETK